jgi:phosphonate transport system substrate-binding protein
MRPAQRTRSRILLAMATAAVVAVLAACGGATAGPGQAAGALPDHAPNAKDVQPGQYYRPTTLHLATISGADEEATTQRYQGLVDYLGKKLGIKVDYVQTTDYSSVIEAMRAGRVDIAVYGPFSYVIASSEAAAVPLVAAPNQTTGELGYHSLIITNVKSGLNTLQDLKGHSMAFADPASTSGFLFPKLILADAGITDLDHYFSATSFSGGHDASLVAVAHNQVDAAGVCDTCIDTYFKQGLADPALIKTIAKSGLIPPSPVAARKDLDPALRQQIIDAYVGLQKDAPDVMMQAEGQKTPPKYSYAPITDDKYQVIRDLADKLHVDLSELG